VSCLLILIFPFPKEEEMFKAIYYFFLVFRAVALEFKIQDLEDSLIHLEMGTVWYAALARFLIKAEAKLVTVQEKLADLLPEEKKCR
jgi:hypothetical protein